MAELCVRMPYALGPMAIGVGTVCVNRLWKNPSHVFPIGKRVFRNVENARKRSTATWNVR